MLGLGPLRVGVGQGVLSSVSSFPSIFTCRARSGYREDPIVRHLEPPLAGHLELSKLSNFRIRLVATPNRTVHVYEAFPADPENAKEKGVQRMRFFVRALVRQVNCCCWPLSSCHPEFRMADGENPNAWKRV